jgi:uncharacterized protein YndB with AHSA1/START domain
VDDARRRDGPPRRRRVPLGHSRAGRRHLYEIGEFREIAPPERLVYTCRSEDAEVAFSMPHEEMLVEVEFVALPGSQGTRVVVAQRGYRRAEDRDAQQQGWPDFLSQLAALAERKAR